MLNSLSKFNIVSMPDFFIDRTVKLPSFQTISKQIFIKLENGGGSIRKLNQIEVKGGNSVNTAYALVKMGVNVNLIIVADKFSENILKNTFSNFDNIELFIVKGKPGYTVALEFPENDKICNVMLSDVGDVANFGPEMLPSKYMSKIDNADMIAFFNWTSNKKGTELVEKVFTRASELKVPTYFAPADITERIKEIPSLFNKLGIKLKILSINENETRILSKTLINEHLSKKYSLQDIIKIVKKLNKKIESTIDIHTPYGSVSAQNGEIYYSKSYKTKQYVSTGAGDVWDAANIVGYLLNLEHEIRLNLANAVASIYISNVNMEPPSINQIISFLNENKLN